MNILASRALQTLLVVLVGGACGGDGPSMLAPPTNAPKESPIPEPTPATDSSTADPGEAPVGEGSNPEDEYAWVTVTWDGADQDEAVNLDLHVLDAEGTHIYYLNTGSNDGDGRFAPHDECPSFDCNGDETQPRESIYWTLEGMEPGTYEAWVHNDGDRSASFDIEIVAGETRVNESGSVGPDEESSRWVFERGDQEPDGSTDCYRKLDRLGVEYQEISISEGACEVKDAVMIDGPVGGITYHVDWSRSTTRFRTACATAVALHESSGMLEQHGITTVYHKGSYNCRSKNGANGLSQHGRGLAFDYAGFETEDGTEYSVIEDWEHDTSSPTTEAGRVLREIGQGLEGVFDLVLDPDHNAEHDDHFHGELSGE